MSPRFQVKRKYRASSRTYKARSAKSLFLSTYNIRTLTSDETVTKLLKQLKHTNWQVIGLSEVRRTGKGHKRLPDGHKLYYNGHTRKKQGGVGFLINKKLVGREEFYHISDRVAGLIITLSEECKINVIQGYAPTSVHKDAKVKKFYENIEEAMMKYETQSLIIMGDFNAKVGTNISGETAIGNYGIGTRNERGKIFVEFAERRGLKITNTFFWNTANKKKTWISPDKKTKNEIDFVLTNDVDIVKCVTVLQEVKLSDHRMVTCEVRPQWKKGETISEFKGWAFK